MTTTAKIATTVTLLVLLGGLGAADYFLTGDEYAAQVSGNGDTQTPADTETPDTETPPAGGVARNQGPDVVQTATELSLTTDASDDLTLLAQVATDPSATIQSLAILKDGDRAGSVTWVQSSDVKNIFIALKEALLTAFSPQMRELRDETILEEAAPVRNLLTFIDPALSEERLVFVRVRDRLYEFHVATGKEEAMNMLIEALTSR